MTDELIARVFNAIAPVLKAHDCWLPLSVRRAVADAVVAVANEEKQEIQQEMERRTLMLQGSRDDNARLRARVAELEQQVVAETVPACSCGNDGVTPRWHLDHCPIAPAEKHRPLGVVAAAEAGIPPDCSCGASVWCGQKETRP